MLAEFPAIKILEILQRDNILPAILFRTARRQCDNDIERLFSCTRLHISQSEQERLIGEIDRVIEKYAFEREVLLAHPHYRALVSTAVGAHHAGQLLVWRLLLEELMSRGLLRLLIATGTVAAGVDFPARTVVITSHSRRGSEGYDVLTSAELQQMAGRAGRRGKDTVGLCLVAPSMFSDARVIHEVSRKPPEPLRSAYFASSSTVLNLLKYRNVDDLKYTVSRSLAAFLDRKSALALQKEAEEDALKLKQVADNSKEQKRLEKKNRRAIREAEDLEKKQLNSLQKVLEKLTKLGFVQGGGLSEKGYWAAELCTTLVLELAEAINDGIFHDLSTDELVAAVASLSGDPHRPYFGIKENPIKTEIFENLELVIERVKEANDGDMQYEVRILPDAALTVLLWMDATNWTEFSGLLRLAKVSEGDVARLVSQTADHLNQISRLTKSHPILAQLASEGRSKILKPPLSEAIVVVN
jgi:ATP-dependent RNA helicase HelY